VDELRPDSSIGSRRSLITYVKDRPGHDRRYAIDAGKVRAELNWAPQTCFERGIRSTVAWYLGHLEWVDEIRTGTYRDWLRLNYEER
jgi:dTDP-glucose 4,6-dehydratase